MTNDETLRNAAIATYAEVMGIKPEDIKYDKKKKNFSYTDADGET